MTTIDPGTTAVAYVASIDGAELRRTEPVRMFEVSVADTTWLDATPDGSNVVLSIVSESGWMQVVMPHVVASNLRQALDDVLRDSVPTKQPRKRRTKA